MKKEQDFSFTDADSTYLEQAYPLLEHRKLFVEKKLLGNRLKNPIIVRIQPKKKLFFFSKISKIKHITLMMEGSTKMAQINGHVNKKLQIQKGEAFFMFIEGKLVDNTKKVEEMSAKYKKEDGILYINYVDYDPFGN